MKLYMDNGYINARETLESPYTFIFGVGARGIGKTYNYLDALVKSKKKFILLRLKQDEADLISSEVANPFKPIKGLEITAKKINKYIGGYYQKDELVGVCMSLNCFASCRGMDFSDFDYIFLDEFIPEKHIKRIPALGEALKNCYETVNRNRELMGLPPVKLIAMANSLNMNNDILISFGLIDVIHKMQKTGEEVYYDKSRSLMMIYPRSSPISDAKAQTALYKLEGAYADMALKNEFREFFEGNIKPQNLKGYRPYCIYDNLCIYRSTQAQRRYYVTETRRGDFSGKEYTNTDFERVSFMRKYINLFDDYFSGKIIFEKAELELIFCNLFKIMK